MDRTWSHPDRAYAWHQHTSEPGAYLCYLWGQSRSNMMSDYIECRTKVSIFRLLDRTSWGQVHIPSWTTGFNSDGVFTMESFSPSFSRLNFTLIVTFVRQSRYHLALPSHRTTHYCISSQLEGSRLELLSSIRVLSLFSWVPNTKYYL